MYFTVSLSPLSRHNDLNTNTVVQNINLFTKDSYAKMLKLYSSTETVSSLSTHCQSAWTWSMYCRTCAWTWTTMYHCEYYNIVSLTLTLPTGHSREEKPGRFFSKRTEGRTEGRKRGQINTRGVRINTYSVKVTRFEQILTTPRYNQYQANLLT